MWSGVSTLNNLDQSLQTIRNEVVRLDSRLSQLTEQMAQSQRHHLNVINGIAKVRLYEIDQGGLQTELTAADQQSAEILQQREYALNTLNEQIDKLNEQIHSDEQSRDQMLQKVNQLSQQIADTEAKVQQKLKADPQYMSQFESAKQADSVAQEAWQKAAQAALDMDQKAAPYRHDKLFIYLWQRGYGTTKFKGNFLTRMLDGWVARLIKYEPSRVNYWNLQEIPVRLQGHAENVTKQAEEAQMALQELELTALKKVGVRDLETDIEKLREKLDAHDDQIESRELELNEKLEVRASFVAGEDEYINRCLERLTQALQHKDLDSIHRYVRDTASPTDDKLVTELQQIEDKYDDVEDDLRAVRALHDKKIAKLKELEIVRRNFKNNRYDDVRSGFGNEALLSSILGQFLQGIVSGGELWRVLQRNQRYRNVGSLPDFGSGGLGDLLGGTRRGRSSKRNSSWHWPQPRGGGGGGFRFPSGRGRRSGGGGGFKTGGGF